jgi:hypothetical protein
MQLSPRLLLATGGVALMLGGTGVALAATGQTGTDRERPGRPARAAIRADRDAFLNDVAKRAGVDPAKLRDAIKNLRNTAGPGPHRAALFGGIQAAADYLGLKPRELFTQLRTKTLAQIATDRGKSVDGLEKALSDAAKTALDRARTNGRITQKEEDAALAQLDASLDDIVNGRDPKTTALAKALGIDRDKLANAIRDAKLAEVDKALADKRITQAQADRLKERIRAGEAGFFGFGFGPGLRGGPGGPRGGRGKGDCDGGKPRGERGERRNGFAPGPRGPEAQPQRFAPAPVAPPESQPAAVFS